MTSLIRPLDKGGTGDLLRTTVGLMRYLTV